MASNQPATRTQPTTTTSAEQKARGANRSTKVAGKLKVLPDQPEPHVADKPSVVPPPPKAVEAGEGSGATGDSDEDEADDEEDADDVEVRSSFVAKLETPAPTPIQIIIRSTIKLT